MTTEEDEQRKQANIAAGRHPLFTSFEDAGRKKARDLMRRTPSWSDVPEKDVLPDPRTRQSDNSLSDAAAYFPPGLQLAAGKEGHFKMDPQQEPTEAPLLTNYQPESET